MKMDVDTRHSRRISRESFISRPFDLGGEGVGKRREWDRFDGCQLPALILPIAPIQELGRSGPETFHKFPFFFFKAPKSVLCQEFLSLLPPLPAGGLRPFIAGGSERERLKGMKS